MCYLSHFLPVSARAAAWAGASSLFSRLLRRPDVIFLFWIFACSGGAAEEIVPGTDLGRVPCGGKAWILMLILFSRIHLMLILVDLFPASVVGLLGHGVD